LGIELPAVLEMVTTPDMVKDDSSGVGQWISRAATTVDKKTGDLALETGKAVISAAILKYMGIP
jgi:hypothetical protein